MGAGSVEGAEGMGALVLGVRVVVVVVVVMVVGGKIVGRIFVRLGRGGRGLEVLGVAGAGVGVPVGGARAGEAVVMAACVWLVCGPADAVAWRKVLGVISRKIFCGSCWSVSHELAACPVWSVLGRRGSGCSCLTVETALWSKKRGSIGSFIGWQMEEH